MFIPTPVSNPSEDHSRVIIACSLSCTSVALVVFTTRSYVRLRIVRSYGWDDAFMALAMILSLALGCVDTAGGYNGAGRHIGDVPPEIYKRGVRLSIISQYLFVLAGTAVKLSVGSTLLRLAGHTAWRYVILTVMAFMATWGIASLFNITLQCWPTSLLWDPNSKGRCWSWRVISVLTYTDSALCMATDVIFAIIIPVPLCWSLDIHLRARISLSAILGLGVFVCACSIIKITYLHRIFENTGDWLWTSWPINLWVMVEVNMGIIAGSLPACRPLLKRLWGGSSAGAAVQSGFLGRGANNDYRLARFGTESHPSRRGTWAKIPILSSFRRPSTHLPCSEEVVTPPPDQFRGVGVAQPSFARPGRTIKTETSTSTVMDEGAYTPTSPAPIARRDTGFDDEVGRGTTYRDRAAGGFYPI